VCMASADVGDVITAGLDAHGAVAAGGAHEFFDGPTGLVRDRCG
jgi:ribosomal protein L21E